MKTTIGIFFGGRSVEHEISVVTALQVIGAFDGARYDIVPVYVSKSGVWYSGRALLDIENYKDTEALQKRCEKVCMRPVYGDHNLYRLTKPLFGSGIVARFDLVLPSIHGTNGEDGSLQGFFEMCGVPYAGCNVLASANGMDKITMKMILRGSGIPVVDYVWFTDKEWYYRRDESVARVESSLKYPVIVKPANLGSSVGISRVVSREALAEAVELAAGFSSRIIVERMIAELREINCSVLGGSGGNRSSVCEEPLRSGEILSYTDKYMGGGKSSKGMQSTRRRIPADLPEAEAERIRQLASKTFSVLGCDGVARIDFMTDLADGGIYVNEINTVPGSFSFYLWEATGVPFGDMLDELVDTALRRKREEGFKTISYERNIFSLGGGGKNGAKGKG